VVLAPRRWCQVGGRKSADDGGKKARSPGRARSKPLKPLRGECRMLSGASAVNTRAHTYYPQRARGCGCTGHPAFPAPSVFEGPISSTTRARSAPRECEAVSWRHRVQGCLKFESERMIETWLARRPKPQNGEVRLRSRFARLRRTRFALSVLRGYAGHASPFRSCVATPDTLRPFGLAWLRHA
jgi:hypothetical protein